MVRDSLFRFRSSSNGGCAVFVEDLVPFSEQVSESSGMSSAGRKNNSESDGLRRRARAPDKPAAISAV